MIPYKKINTAIGWLVFALSLLVYTLTLEPSVSFWDCGEFISGAYRLQVVHPPGAPLYQMLGRVFSLFSFGNRQWVAFCINMLSAVSSSFCVLLTYFITVRFAQKIVAPLGTTLTKQQYISIWGAGVIAALTFAFSDTFWFSAVEAEVYSLSSLFTLLVFWAALNAVETKTTAHYTRWLLFIALLTGLSIGVHLLNLLVLPAVVGVLYFNRYGNGFWHTIKALVLGFLVLFALQFVIIPYIPFFASLADRWAVNQWHLGIGSGAIVFLFSVVLIIAISLLVTRKYKLQKLHTALLCLAFVLVGYSSYLFVPIRAAAHPPLNINRADNAASFAAYLNREQYGTRALVHGPAFNAPITAFEKGKPLWRVNEKGEYEVSDYSTRYVFDKNYTMWFPRMGDMFDESSATGYVGWTNMDEQQPPTQQKNLAFFFKYQVVHMYMRYHLWNFAGRQNDAQGHGNALSGGVESGIPIFDRLVSAPTTGLPLSLENKGKNHYYFLPLLLGLAGLFFHAKKQKETFLPLLVLFLFTGFFLCLYLNAPPFEPRERDYVFVGSYQVYSVWVGLGALWLMRFLHKWLPKGIWVGFFVSFLCVPVLLISQNWDDHNRSHRSFAHDYAFNFLGGLAPNAIVFVHGDNDTYPLWYVQNVEGFRTDVRVVNANLLGSDWGAFELEEQKLKSAAFKLSLSPYLYQKGSRSAIKINKGLPVRLQTALLFAANDSNAVPLRSGKMRNAFPSNKIILPFETPDTVEIDDSYLSRADVIILDIIANNYPQRPIYFASRSANQNVPFLSSHLSNEGLVSRLVNSSDTIANRLNTAMLNIQLYHWQLNGFNDKAIYHDPEAKKIAKYYLGCMALGIQQLMAKNKIQEAGRMALFCAKSFLVATTRFENYDTPLQVLRALYADNAATANTYAQQLSTRLMQETQYYHSLKNTVADYSARRAFAETLQALQQLRAVLLANHQNQKAVEIEKFLAFFVVNKK